MKKFVIAFVCAVMAHNVYAETNACLNDLQGDFYQFSDKKLNHIMIVKYENGTWKFKSPDDGSEFEDTSDFRYKFDQAKEIPAKPIPEKNIQSFGMAILNPYMEKSINAKGFRFGCGLVGNDFYVMSIDLSEANQELLKNLALFAVRHNRADDQSTLQEINEMRRQKYFLGEYFHLDGVISTIIGDFLQKR